MKNCKTCDAFVFKREFDGHRYGDCCLRAPIVLPDDGSTTWPYVNEDEGCLDHRPRPMPFEPGPVPPGENLLRRMPPITIGDDDVEVTAPTTIAFHADQARLILRKQLAWGPATYEIDNHLRAIIEESNEAD